MATDFEALAARTVERRIILFEREVTAALQKALVDIRQDIAQLYERFAVDGVLSKAEMTRANRLVTAERQLVRHLNPALAANMTTYSTLHPEMYDEAFFRYAWSIDQTAQVRLAYGRLNIRAIRANLANREFADSLRRYSPMQRARIREALNNGLVRGQGFPAMMRDIKEALSMSRGDAIRIVRTEGQRAANAGTAEAFAEARGEGVKGKEIWMSTLDAVTRDQHIVMDQQVRGDDGLFQFPNGETAPHPLHSSLSAGNSVNCRCVMRFEIVGYEPQLRRTREDGLIPHQSFPAWRQGQR